MNNANLLMFRDFTEEEDDCKSFTTQWSQRHLLRNQRERQASDVLSHASTNDFADKRNTSSRNRNNNNTQGNALHRRRTVKNQFDHHNHNGNHATKDDAYYKNENEYQKENRINSNSHMKISHDAPYPQAQSQYQGNTLPQSFYSPIAVLKIKNKSKNKKQKKPYLKSKSKSKSASLKNNINNLTSPLKKSKDEYSTVTSNNTMHAMNRQQQHHQSSRQQFVPLQNSNDHDSMMKKGTLMSHNHKNNQTNEQKSSLISSSYSNKRQYKVWNDDSMDNENFTIATKSINLQTRSKGSKSHVIQQQHQKQQHQKQKQILSQQQSLPLPLHPQHYQRGTSFNNNTTGRGDKLRLLSSHDEMSPLQSKSISVPTKSSNNNNNVRIKTNLPSTSPQQKHTQLAYHKMTIASEKKYDEQSSTFMSSPKTHPKLPSYSHDEMSPLDVRLGIEPGNYFNYSGLDQQGSSSGIGDGNDGHNNSATTSRHTLWKRSPFKKGENQNDNHHHHRDNDKIPLNQQSSTNEVNDNVSRELIDPNGGDYHDSVVKNDGAKHNDVSSSSSSSKIRNVGQGYRYASKSKSNHTVPTGNNNNNNNLVHVTSVRRKKMIDDNKNIQGSSSNNNKIRLSMRELTRGGQDVIERRIHNAQLLEKSHNQQQISQYSSSSSSSQRGMVKDGHKHIISSKSIVPEEKRSSLSKRSNGQNHSNQSQVKPSGIIVPKEEASRYKSAMESNQQQQQNQSLQRRRHRHNMQSIDTNRDQHAQMNNKRPIEPHKSNNTVAPSTTPTKSSKQIMKEKQSFDLQSKVDESWAPSPIKVDGSFVVLETNRGKKKSRSAQAKATSTSRGTHHHRPQKAKDAQTKKQEKEEKFMREVAAIVIQTFFRRHLAYRLTIERYSAVITIQRFFRVIIEDQKARRAALNNSITMMYDLAAVEIQKVWRGWWVRDCINVDNYCASVIQRNTRIYLLKCRIEKKRLAAIMIQKHWRGYITRKIGLKRRRSLQDSKKNKAISHSEKTLKTGTGNRLHKRNQPQLQNKTNSRTIRVFSKLSTGGGGTSRPSLIPRKKKGNGLKSISSTIHEEEIITPSANSGPSKPKPIQRKTSKESQTSSQRNAAMHTEDIVWKWKMMRERNKEGNRMSEC